MAPLLMLLLALLASTMAHAQTPELEVQNDLSDNDAKCTIAAPELGGGTGEASFYVPARSSNTEPLQASQSLSSPTFRVELFGPGPLGRGCRPRGCCFFFCPSGKRYTTRGDFLQRLVSLLGYKIKIVRNCGSDSQPKLLLEGYATPGLVKVATACVSQD